MFILETLLKFLIVVVPVLIAVAYFTHAERKILGAIQRRRGPNVVGAYGLLQPLSDGFKLLIKEFIAPSSSHNVIFRIAPMLTFIVSLIGWSLIPFGKHSFFAELNIGILYILGISSLGVYGIIMSGWASNSKYAFLGALRSTAQMISYEISIGFIIVTIALCCGSFNLADIISWQKHWWFVFTFFPLFLVFFTCGLAETNRHPFDLPEAEAELVSGYNVEYSAMSFALFSLGEYSNMLMMSALTVILFFGGWLPFDIPFYNYEPSGLLYNIIHFLPYSFNFGIKICFFVILFVIMRAALPRYRYDQLMNLGWKVFLPFTLAHLIFIFNLLMALGVLSI
jgi:NADH-quinone oxidoreductase subunit H